MASCTPSCEHEFHSFCQTQITRRISHPRAAPTHRFSSRREMVSCTGNAIHQTFMQHFEQSFVCPCCGYPDLDCAPYENMSLPPWLDHGSPPYHQRYGAASYDCCSCCGFEYGFDDDPGASSTASSFAEYLQRWISDGCEWFEPAKRPMDWSLDRQLDLAAIKMPPQLPE
jgi:hypothetical protein